MQEKHFNMCKILAIKDFSEDGVLYKIAFLSLCLVALVSPVLSLFLGLSLPLMLGIASAVPVWYFVVNNKWNYLYGTNICKIMIIFILYAAVSSLWAVVPYETLNLIFRMLLLFIVAISAITFFRDVNLKHKEILSKCLLYSLIFSLMVANFEIFSDGILTKLFRSFEHNSKYIYHLTDLNRGSTYLSLLLWPVMAYLMKNKKNLFAVILYIVTLATSVRLESQSAAMSIMLGTIVFFFMLFMKERGLKIIMVMACIGIVFVAMTAKIMNPEHMFKILPNIPGSASEYRLYIWDYAAEKAYQKPFLGWGFNASRSFPVKQSEYFLGGKHPLPLHPHNNVLQVWLELGIVGLFIFAAFLLTFLQRIKELYRGGEQSHCLSKFEDKKRCCPITKICAYFKEFNNDTRRALAMGLFTGYFAIGETCYGMWQNWWVAGGVLALVFIDSILDNSN